MTEDSAAWDAEVADLRRRYHTGELTEEEATNLLGDYGLHLGEIQALLETPAKDFIQ